MIKKKAFNFLLLLSLSLVFSFQVNAQKEYRNYHDITIKLKSIQSKNSINASIELTDILGKQVSTIFQGEIPSGESKYFIDAATLSSGVYFITLKSGKFTLVQSLVVK